MDEMTLLIDPDTRDLVFDDDGSFKKIYETDTIVQNVRHALITWKNEFFADDEHGTDYDRIMGVNQNELDDDEVREVIREAVFQEPYVSRVEKIDVTYENRNITVQLLAVLMDEEKITLEVTT